MNNLNLPDPKMMDVAVPSNLKLGIDFNRQKVNNGIEPEEFNRIKKTQMLFDRFKRAK
jgi:sulfur dioxygenase